MPEFSTIIDSFIGWIDPHLPPYNCKGDVSSSFEATTDASGLIGIPNRDFTSSDIGKLIYADMFSGARTIQSVSNGKALVSGASLGANASGRAVTFGTDDTDGLQRALDDAQYTKGYADQALDRGDFVGTPINGSKVSVYHGRIVRLRGGCAYMVRNPQSSYDQGKHACLIQHRRTGLVGETRDSSWIYCTPDRYGYGIMNENADQNGDITFNNPTDGFCDGMHLANFTIDGMKGYSTNVNSLDNIHWNVSFNGYLRIDPRNEITGVNSRESPRDGFLIQGRGDFYGSRLHAETASGIGIHLRGLIDSTLVQCMSAGARKTGIKIDRCQDLWLHGCKSYYSGQNGGTSAGDSANYWLTADQPKNGCATLIGCRGQEARGSGFLIESGYNQLIGCQSQDPGQLALATGTGPLSAGVHLNTDRCMENKIDVTVQPNVRMFRTPVWAADNAVFVGPSAAGNKGTIDTLTMMDGLYTDTKIGGLLADRTANPRLLVDNASMV